MLALVALLAFLAPQNPAPGPAVDWAELMRRFQADAAALQKTGAPLDLAALKLEKLMPGELAREIGKRETDFFGSGWYEMLWVLGQGFGLKVDATPDVFEQSFQRMKSGALPACYIPARKAIVIDEDHYTQDARFDHALLHELALASLDQQPGGLAALRVGTTTDQVLCDRAWIGGRAELLARNASGRGLRAGLTASEERSGIFALVGLAGDAEVARQERLPEAERTRPTSGAALLHGAPPCAPAAIALDALEPPGTRLLREDVLGELGLRFVLSMAGAHPVQALEAGIGLRGDKLRLWKAGERERAFGWRMVFANESDARELEDLLGKLARGTRVRRAQVLDWCFANRPELEAQIAASLAALPAPPALGESEARSALEFQAARLARQPHMRGERWLLPELELAWKLPGAWLPSFYQADPIVYLGPPDDGFRDNLTFREYALPPDATAEKVLEGARKSFEGLAGAKLVRAQLVQTRAGPGVIVEYTQSAGGKQLHQLELQLVLPGRKQTVTATVLAKHWAAVGATVAAVLAATERSTTAEPRK